MLVPFPDAETTNRRSVSAADHRRSGCGRSADAPTVRSRQKADPERKGARGKSSAINPCVEQRAAGVAQHRRQRLRTARRGRLYRSLRRRRHPHIAHAAGQDGASRSGGSTTRRRPRGSPSFAPRGGHRGDSDATMVRSIGRGPAVSSWRRRALRVSAESLEPVEPPAAGALRGGGDRLRRGRRIHAVARGHRGCTCGVRVA